MDFYEFKWFFDINYLFLFIKYMKSGDDFREYGGVGSLLSEFEWFLCDLWLVL